ncbi:MAG: hypothetical protein WBW81_03475 [Methylocella sp.]
MAKHFLGFTGKDARARERRDQMEPFDRKGRRANSRNWSMARAVHCRQDTLAIEAIQSEAGNLLKKGRRPGKIAIPSLARGSILSRTKGTLSRQNDRLGADIVGHCVRFRIN